jgi:hypothetical protein
VDGELHMVERRKMDERRELFEGEELAGERRGE